MPTITNLLPSARRGGGPGTCKSIETTINKLPAQAPSATLNCAVRKTQRPTSHTIYHRPLNPGALYPAPETLNPKSHNSGIYLNLTKVKQEPQYTKGKFNGILLHYRAWEPLGVDVLLATGKLACETLVDDAFCTKVSLSR